MKPKNTYDVIVIGGGAAGMMAACVASDHGARVLLIEKNKRLGEKLRITGGGRCNITNAEENIRVFLKNYGKAEKYLYSAFSEFDAQDTMQFFENLKLPIKVEARKRAFPVSEKAADVVHALVNRLDKNGVVIVKNSPVTRITKHNEQIESVWCEGVEYTAKNYILATGGVSRPETGSSGDGFTWLKELGLSVRTPSPNITPLAVKEINIVQSVAGVSAKSVNIVFYCDGVRAFKLEGDILFTHFGISGPTILNSAYQAAELLDAGIVTIKIDCFPHKNEKELDNEIVAVLNGHGSKQLKNVLSYFAPQGLTPLLKEILKDKINFEAKTSEVNRETRKFLVSSLKNITLTIDKLMGFERAVVADGGVSLDEIDTRTFRSKKIGNLFVTGDLLDINRPSGGYSLQLCWTTGYVAGTYSSQNLNAK